jgi:hypothetical protein
MRVKASPTPHPSYELHEFQNFHLQSLLHIKSLLLCTTALQRICNNFTATIVASNLRKGGVRQSTKMAAGEWIDINALVADSNARVARERKEDETTEMTLDRLREPIRWRKSLETIAQDQRAQA